MARKDIRMEELVEVLYQWQKWRNISLYTPPAAPTPHLSSLYTKTSIH